MVRNLVEGVNVFGGTGHWKDIKSTYNFTQSAGTVKNYWYSLRREEHVSMIDGRWVLTSEMQQSYTIRSTSTDSPIRGMMNNTVTCTYTKGHTSYEIFTHKCFLIW